MANALFFVLIFHISSVLSQNELCANMEPVCSDFTFTSIGSNTTAEAGNDYDCTGSQPSPTWWYFKMNATSPSGGNLDMLLSFSSDHDFVIWGPFADVATAKATCGSLSTIVDCSYAGGSGPETPSIASTEPGQVFVLMISNYAETTQDVTLSTDSTSTAITDCSVTIVTTTTPAPTTPAPTTPAPTTPAPTAPAPTAPVDTDDSYSSDDDDDESSSESVSVDFDAAVAAVYKSDDSQSIEKGYHLNIEISDNTMRHLYYMALTAVAVNIAMCLFFAKNRKEHQNIQ